MTVVKKLVLTGGGLALLFPASVGLIRVMSGHDEPIVVDNPQMQVNFGFRGHRMNLKRNSDGRVEELSRDIAALDTVFILFRNGYRDANVDASKPITLEDSKNGKIEISTKASQPYNQFLVNLPGRQFGECRFDSLINNRCFAKEDDRRLRTVKYTDLQQNEKYLCLNKAEDMKVAGQTCPLPANEAPTGLSFTFKY
ncbi:MAG: hypothetical protein K2X03_31170 [Bryobacteraceae bacterium]|nr:hypothetical protein [Bryobacteraceae bacterium]